MPVDTDLASHKFFLSALSLFSLFFGPGRRVPKRYSSCCSCWNHFYKQESRAKLRKPGFRAPYVPAQNRI